MYSNTTTFVSPAFMVGKYWYIMIRNCRIETKSVLKYVVNVSYGPDASSTAGFDL